MMSLFSSFDLKMFYFQTFILTMLSFNLFFNLPHNLSISGLLYSNFMKNIQNFFYSVKPLNFSKFTNYIFSFIMSSVFLVNYSSIWPYNFSFSSQVSLIFSLSLMFWVSLIMISLFSNIKGLLSHLIPSGTPFSLVWFLFAVELVSNFIRPLTLMVRLVANILAGHLLMILLSNLVLNYLPLVPLYILLNLVETFVALIQSYIFATMVCLYFSEME